ncbi:MULTISPECIES: hypothetical protein [Corallococcus]|uniref:hypothetical protein n=1 Tax=Corallococcus TaxID=83461 RepID=UPI0013151AAA|nr:MULTISPECIES: hypothetical protein [Corallococcus]
MSMAEKPVEGECLSATSSTISRRLPVTTLPSTLIENESDGLVKDPMQAPGRWGRRR